MSTYYAVEYPYSCVNYYFFKTLLDFYGSRLDNISFFHSQSEFRFKKEYNRLLSKKLVNIIDSRLVGSCPGTVGAYPNFKAYSCAYNTRTRKVFLNKILPILFGERSQFFDDFPLLPIRDGFQVELERKRWEIGILTEDAVVYNWENYARSVDFSFIDKDGIARFWLVRHEQLCELLISRGDEDFLLQKSIVNSRMAQCAEPLEDGSPELERWRRYRPQPTEADFWQGRRKAAVEDVALLRRTAYSPSSFASSSS